jgi:hypothetical protein
MAEGSLCWLCKYNDDNLSLRLHKLILDKAGSMGAEELACAVHEILVAHQPDAEGAGLDQVKTHIQKHMLNPGVRVAVLLRSLLDLTDSLHGILMDRDEEGNTVVDAKNVAVYLKVVAEVMQMYKTGDASKLLFADSGKGV